MATSESEGKKFTKEDVQQLVYNTSLERAIFDELYPHEIEDDELAGAWEDAYDALILVRRLLYSLP